jgi:hypothetical protein
MQVHDRAQIFVALPTTSSDGSQVTVPKTMYIGTLDRSSSLSLQLPIAAAVPGLQLDILVKVLVYFFKRPSTYSI